MTMSTTLLLSIFAIVLCGNVYLTIKTVNEAKSYKEEIGLMSSVSSNC